jgi:hypothetical protein
MDDARAFRNIAFGILAALLCYYLAESYFNWPPLQIPLGGFVLELRHIVLAALGLFVVVRLYLTLTGKSGGQS